MIHSAVKGVRKITITTLFNTVYCLCLNQNKEKCLLTIVIENSAATIIVELSDDALHHSVVVVNLSRTL